MFRGFRGLGVRGLGFRLEGLGDFRSRVMIFVQSWADVVDGQYPA